MKRKNTLIKLKEKERELRQKLIIKAAREVFGEKTYDTVSMAEIARAAGMAKSSIYTYFKNQEELYVEIAYRDTQELIKGLRTIIHQRDNYDDNMIKAISHYFLDYYIINEAQWRMITHLALHGNKDQASMERLNIMGRRLMDIFDEVFLKMDRKQDTRLLSHTLFSALSGILIAYRKYPGRTEEERIAHMKSIAGMFEAMVAAFMEKKATAPI